MYFLAKNLRSCSRTFYGTPGKLKFYKNGVLNWRYLARNISYFITHPEQIKQKLKENDAHMLCQFFDSEEYKSRVTQFLETQGRILSKETIAGAKPPGTIKYQHVLSCAQPSIKKPKGFVAEDLDSEWQDEDSPKKRRIKRGTIFEEIIKRKGNVEMHPNEDTLKGEIKPRKFRQRSTIMPIFLKKIRQRRETLEEEPEVVVALDSQTARRLGRVEDEEPLYARILHRSTPHKKKPHKKLSPTQSDVIITKQEEQQPPQNNKPPPNVPIQLEDPIPVKLRTVDHKEQKVSSMEKVSYKYSPQKNVLETVDPQVKTSSRKCKLDQPAYKLNKNTSKTEGMNLGVHSNLVSLRMASSTAKVAQKSPTTKLCPKKNMNLKSFAEFLCVEPVKTKKIKTQLQTVDEKRMTIKVLRAGGKKAVKPIYKLMEEVQNSRTLKALECGDKLEGKSTLKQVTKNKREKKEQLENKVSSLYTKVKLGSIKKAALGETNQKPTCYLDKVSSRLKHAEPTYGLPKSKPITEHESFTYKIVTRNRERYEAKLRERFRVSPPFWQKIKTVKEEKQTEGKSVESHQLSEGGPNQKVEVVSRNLQKNLNRPVPHIVEHPNKSKPGEINQYHGYHKYPAVKELPKTTPEGYRVLLYSVRDPDPTKMNFNDVVKGFCMYNDCVLSEDGLQEGYIVMFDMKDVSIGHLARVSLPALKCFLYYIQDAHPCRIKQIHVLNTATWIHHVMRLVVPLVRSELLNLVKFHKGSVPDKFPVELLPMDYGGEAPTVEELDVSTKSLLDKYRHWLIESEHLKADESKRARKAGFWNLFQKNPQQVELDEKTILRNLQID